MGRKPLRLYTQKDWRDAVGLDRLYMHLMEPERWTLLPQEKSKLEALRSVWAIICNKSSTIERITIIRTALGVTERSAFKYVKDATTLFLETLDVDHELELRLAYSRFLRIHDAAKKEGDHDNARRALDSAMKVRAELEIRQPKKGRLYAQIIFTDDPKALESSASSAEDAEFEEIHEEGYLLESEAVGVFEGN